MTDIYDRQPYYRNSIDQVIEPVIAVGERFVGVVDRANATTDEFAWNWFLALFRNVESKALKIIIGVLSGLVWVVTIIMLVADCSKNFSYIPFGEMIKKFSTVLHPDWWSIISFVLLAFIYWTYPSAAYFMVLIQAGILLWCGISHRNWFRVAAAVCLGLIAFNGFGVFDTKPIAAASPAANAVSNDKSWLELTMNIMGLLFIAASIGSFIWDKKYGETPEERKDRERREAKEKELKEMEKRRNSAVNYFSPTL